MNLIARLENIASTLLPPRPRSAPAVPPRRLIVPGEAPAEATIDLGFYLNLLRVYSRTIGVFIAVCLLLAIGYLHVTTPLYTVTLQVTPVETSNSSLQSSLSSLAGVASLAGVTLPGSQGQKQLDLYLAALDSPAVANALLKDNEIAKVLFAGSWDAENKSWREPSNPLGAPKNLVKQVLGFPVQSWHPPTPQDVMEIIEKEVVVEYKPTSPIVTITYKHKDPEFARRFLLALHTAADGELKERAMQRATAYIAYLTSELEHVTSADHRQALINTLSSQEALRMSAGANISYSVDVFSVPTASSRPTNPQPKVVLMGAVTAGLLIGCIFVVIRYRPRQ